MKDFAPVAYLGASPNVILTRPASGITSIQDLIAKAKAEPGKITYSTPGVGSVSQLAVELLELRTNINVVHVPYSGRGTGGASGDRRHDRIASVNVAGMMGFVQSGSLKALVQTGQERWPDCLTFRPLSRLASPMLWWIRRRCCLRRPAHHSRLSTARQSRSQGHGKPDVHERMLKARFAVHSEGPEQLRARIAREVRCGRNWSSAPVSICSNRMLISMFAARGGVCAEGGERAGTATSGGLR